MISTTVFAATALCLLFGFLLLWAWLLRVGLRWKKVENVTRARIVRITVLFFVLERLAALMFALARVVTTEIQPQGMSSNSNMLWFFEVVELSLLLILPTVIVWFMFAIPLSRSFQAAAPTLLAPLALLAVNTLIVRPLLFEGFKMPTNSMAPSILGTHQEETCGKCGSLAYHPPLPDFVRPQDVKMICRDHFHVTPATEFEGMPINGDWFLVAKFCQPRRWDIITFKHPNDPATLIANRLVGLPGEVITIKDGHAWADGKKLTPPDSLRGLEYVAEFPNGGPVWGSPARPAILGDDEYFVLGDFSVSSRDARFWDRSLEGREHPYAIPESSIDGVVTHIYWPLQRMRVFR